MFSTLDRGRLIAAGILGAWAVFCGVWVAAVVNAAESEPSWPTVCRVVMPEDLDR
jgi:hypothetical protein